MWLWSEPTIIVALLLYHNGITAMRVFENKVLWRMYGGSNRVARKVLQRGASWSAGLLFAVRAIKSIIIRLAGLSSHGDE
jgi:hypothetical protein